jgi:hypothetical protein
MLDMGELFDEIAAVRCQNALGWTEGFGETKVMPKTMRDK